VGFTVRFCFVQQVFKDDPGSYTFHNVGILREAMKYRK